MGQAGSRQTCTYACHAHTLRRARTELYAHSANHLAVRNETLPGLMSVSSTPSVALPLYGGLTLSGGWEPVVGSS